MNTIPLDWLLHYELQAAERYRRYVTLILTSSSLQRARLHQLLSQSLRGCDAIVQNNGSISVVMTDTQMTDALRVIERLKKACGEDNETFFSVATYPQDGVLPAKLLAKAQLRLEQARATGRRGD